MYHDAREQIRIAVSNQESVIVIGNSGCGKTTLCEEVFKQTGHNVLMLCYESYATHREIEDVILDFFNTCFLDQRPKLLFLDDVDVLLTNNRFASLFLLSIIKKHCVIMTTCVSEERRCAEFKKNVQTVRIVVPDIDELYVQFKALYSDVCDERIRQVICDCNCNLR